MGRAMDQGGRQGRVEILTYESRLLADNPLGDPSLREVGVYLPPGYDEGGRRYPVVLMLPGFSGTGLQLLNRGPWAPPLDRRMDGLVARGEAAPAILVLPDCFTRYGGSQYVDSPAIGRYASHLTEEVIPLVDARFRTLPAREARGVIGKSSGGFGALLLGMRRPDLFAAVASHAGDCAFELAYARDFGKALLALERRGGLGPFLAWFEAQPQKPGALFDVMGLLCCAAAWSPSPSGPYGFGQGLELPWHPVTGEVRDEVFARWLAIDPLRLVEDPAAQAALGRLSLVFLDAGLADEYFLQLGARRLAARLRALGLPVVHEEFEGGHMNTAHRYDRSLALVTTALASS